MAPWRPRVQRIGNGTFAAVIRAYLTSPKFKDELSPSSQATYRHILSLAERPEHLGALHAAIVRPSHVQLFLDTLSDRPSLKSLAKSVIRAVEKWAILRDYISMPITLGTEASQPDDGHTPWSEAQVRLGETYAGEILQRVITLQGNTGQRGSDIVKMRWSDIEEHDGRPGINVVQQKTGREVWVPFTQELITTMATWERRPTFILLRPDGSPWTRPQLTARWHYARSHIPELEPCKDLVLHGLRGFACVRLRRAGASESMIADTVGMSIDMVKRYCRKAIQVENALAALYHLEGKNASGTASVVTFPLPRAK